MQYFTSWSLLCERKKKYAHSLTAKSQTIYRHLLSRMVTLFTTYLKLKACGFCTDSVSMRYTRSSYFR